MKKLFICILLLVFTVLVNAQGELMTYFNDSHTGINQSLVYTKMFRNKYEVGGGLKINFNRYAHPDNQQKIFYKRLYATKPIHSFGGEAFVNRYLFEELDRLKPFIFYNIRLSYSTTRNIGFSPYTYSEKKELLYKRYDTNFGPFTWLEQYIGFGYKIDILKSVYFLQKVGFGVDIMFGKDEQLVIDMVPTWEFCYIHSFGLGYRF